MRNRIRALVPIIMLLPLASASAATCYVDFVGGADTNDGRSPRSAFQHAPGDPAATGAAAAFTPGPGDRIAFKGGVVYRGGVAIAWSGTAEQPIIIDGNRDGGYGEGPAIMDGSLTVTGWTRCRDAAEAGGNAHFQHLWKARLPAGTTAWGANLLQGGRTLCLAQYPTPADYNFIDLAKEFVPTTAGQLRIDAATHPILAELGGERLVGCYLQAYRSTNRVSVRKITAWDQATGTVSFAKLETPPYPDRGAIAVVNSSDSRVLDAAGEYVVLEADPQAPSVLLWPLDERDPETSGITVAVETTAFRIAHQVGHVQILGFTIRNYQYGINNHQDGHWNTDADRNRGLRIAGNIFERMRSGTTERTTACNLVQAEDSLIEDNVIRDTFKARGICLHTVWRCSVRRNVLTGIFGGPITFFMANDSEIVGNRIGDSTATHTNGITVYEQCHRILVADNVVWNSGIPMTCENSQDITVRGNVFDSRDIDAQALSFWHGVGGEVVVEDNILLSGKAYTSGFTIAGLGDKTGATFASMRTTLRGNIMTGPMIMVMDGHPWKAVSASGNVYLANTSGYVLGADERVEPDLGKLVGGIAERQYTRLIPGHR